jgi:hypothetical protein
LIVIFKRKITYYDAERNPYWVGGFSWNLQLRRGIMLAKVVDEPNEADLTSVHVYGIGYETYFHKWVWPWKPLKEVV